MTAMVAGARNRRLAYGLGFVALCMVALSFAAVPVYDMVFGARTGAMVGEVAAPSGAVLARPMTMRFDANVANSMGWTVTAPPPLTDKVGAVGSVEFLARNDSDKAVTGVAVFNVSPGTATHYFKQVKCFCTVPHTLQPGESLKLPVTFFIDPALNKDQDLDPLQNITLSYTFYASDKQGS